jgi:hypothetical protein
MLVKLLLSSASGLNNESSSPGRPATAAESLAPCQWAVAPARGPARRTSLSAVAQSQRPVPGQPGLQVSSSVASSPPGRRRRPPTSDGRSGGGPSHSAVTVTVATGRRRRRRRRSAAQSPARDRTRDGRRQQIRRMHARWSWQQITRIRRRAIMLSRNSSEARRLCAQSLS